MEIATADNFLVSNAFFIIASFEAKLKPCWNLPTFPITPFNLMCATTGFLLKIIIRIFY